MTEHNGNDRGQGPRRGSERSSSDGARGGREFSGKAPRQGGGRPAKAEQGRDDRNRGGQNRDGQNRDGQNRDSQNRNSQSRTPWKPRSESDSGFRSADGERRNRPDGSAVSRPKRDGERFPKRDERGFSARSTDRRDDRKSEDRSSRTPERSGGWKPRSSETPRGGSQERRPFSRDANGYGRPSTGRDQESAGRRSHSSDGPRREGQNREGQNRDTQRSAPWKSKNAAPAESAGRERPFNRDANGYRRADGEERRAPAGPTNRGTDRGAPRGPREERGAEAPARVHNPRDLRSANRPDRERSPEIDEGVTGAELDRVTRAQLRTLESKNGEWVAKHLVMAGRLIDADPELSFQHALAASRRGGRLAAVREAVGLTAYAAGHYAEALREFRTYRRISGSNVHLPLMADSERGLGRPDRALDAARSEEASQLDSTGQVELAIVVSGARADLGQKEAALAALEISQLDKNRAFSYSPRLFRAYADALAAVGRDAEAISWRSQAALADQALGADLEPEIIDLDDEADDDFEPESDPATTDL